MHIREKSLIRAENLEVHEQLEIEGVDLQPCGGTHLKSTGEVGKVRIGKVEKKGRRDAEMGIAAVSRAKAGVHRRDILQVGLEADWHSAVRAVCWAIATRPA